MISDRLSSSSSTLSDISDDCVKHSNPYDHLIIIKKIGEGKVPVFLATCPLSRIKYAIKFFPRKEFKFLTHFENESRFLDLKHPNIITFLHSEKYQEFTFDESCLGGSQIIMEYCPFGDIENIFEKAKRVFSESFIRSIFHQIIEGIEYLHGLHIAHMDIKPKNLLIGNDFLVKIADFDLSYKEGDKCIGKGTKPFRAPELERGECNDPQAADVYAAGVVLFYLKSRGTLPTFANGFYKGANMQLIMYKDRELFWKIHSSLQIEGSDFFDKDFKDLFQGMTANRISDRWTLEKVKYSAWYNKEICSPNDFRAQVLNYLFS